MANKKSKPKRRKPNLAGSKRFLFVTKAVLGAKYKERDRCLKELTQLNVDIPNLERTVRALEAQLHGGEMADAAPHVGSGNSASTRVSRGAEGLSSPVGSSPTHATNDEIPPEIRATLPPEDFSKFGSHFGTEPAEKEDFLPEITGKEVIPEKKA